MTERERFESWLETQPRMDGNERYYLWHAWQAARKLDVPSDVREAAKRFNPSYFMPQDAITLAEFAAKLIKEQTQ